MPNYRRARTPGGTYFFTLVSYQRQKFLCNEIIRTALRDALTIVRTKLPFTIDAMVLMPDHLHAVWTLPADDGDYSARWSMIKRLVTQAVGGRIHHIDHGGCGGAHGAPYGEINSDVALSAHGAPYGDGRGFVGCAVRTEELLQRAVRTDKPDDSNIHPSRLKRREGAIWQRRFWEHQVRDQDDFNRCIDYLHWNPVKHGYASKVSDWPYSTFHRFVRQGVYPEDWGGQGVGDGGVFGE